MAVPVFAVSSTSGSGTTAATGSTAATMRDDYELVKVFASIQLSVFKL